MKSTNPDPVGAPVEWSRSAILGAVLAVLGFLTLWLVFGLFLAAAAAVCGHVARYETSVRPLRGRRIATFGLLLGYGTMLSFPILVLVVGLTFPAMEMWRTDQESANRAESRTKASRLYVACEAFARANRDHYPADWKELSGRFVPAEEFADLLRSPYPGGSRIAFELVSHDRPVLPAIGDSVIVIQEIAPSRVPEIAVVYADGRVATLHNPDHEIP